MEQEDKDKLTRVINTAVETPVTIAALCMENILESLKTLNKLESEITQAKMTHVALMQQISLVLEEFKEGLNGTDE